MSTGGPKQAWDEAMAKKKALEAEAVSKALAPDEFELLLREAAFSAANTRESDLTRTFSTTPRGIEGPAGKIMGQRGMTTGDVATTPATADAPIPGFYGEDGSPAVQIDPAYGGKTGSAKRKAAPDLLTILMSRGL